LQFALRVHGTYAPQKRDAGPQRAYGRDAAGPARPRGRGSLADRPPSQRNRRRPGFFAPRAVVAAENLLLRHQLIAPPIAAASPTFSEGAIAAVVS